MHLASKVVVLFKDADGFGSAVACSLRPSIASQRREEAFELPLHRYGVTNHKASGELIHFIDSEGRYQVSLILAEVYDPPVLACALNEIVSQIKPNQKSEMPTLIVPIFNLYGNATPEAREVSGSGRKLKFVGHQIGPETDTNRVIAARTHNGSSKLQIHNEPAAFLLHLARLKRIPASFISGEEMKAEIDIEMIGEMGAFLADVMDLNFSEDHLYWNPRKKTVRMNTEPWRALYG